MAGAAFGSALSAASPADHDVVALAAGAVDDGDGLLLARCGLLGRGFGAVLGSARGRHGRFFSRGCRLTQRDAGDRLAAERIVAEDGKASEGNQKQAEQHGKRLDSGKRQPKSALPAHRFLSERRAQIVGRLCHGPPRINRADDTTAGQVRGRSSAAAAPQRPCFGLPGRSDHSKKGGPKAAPFRKELIGRARISSPPCWRACRSRPCRRSPAPSH